MAGKEHKIIMLTNNAPLGSKRNWTKQEKYQFQVMIAYDTESGDTCIHSDLPMKEEDLKILVKKMKGEI